MSAQQVRKLRESLGLTQEELAARLGVTHTAVCYWEAGKRQPSGPASILLRQLEGEADFARRKITNSA